MSIRACRDGYNRTNLVLRLGPVELDFSATHEPWDGPTVRFLIRHERRGFVVLSASWG